MRQLISIDEAHRVNAVLGALATSPGRVGANAAHWSGRVTARSGRRELQRVVWLLQGAANVRDLPHDRRRAARYWSAYLAARL